METFDVTEINGLTTIWVDSDRIDACLNYYRDRKIDRLGISPSRGYTIDNVDFLNRYPDVNGLVIVFPPGSEFNTSPLLGLSELRSLTLSAPVGLQLRYFKKLTEFSGYWHKDLELSGCNNIERLDIIGYKAKTGDLTTFPDLPSLKHLGLVKCSIASLRGISKFPLLISLSVAYSGKFDDLDEIGMLTNLEVLDFQKCPRMKQYDVFRSLKNLRVLRVNSCGEIPSLSFIYEMPRLEEFRFVNTNVADGNLAPLLRLGRVGFLPKRHYSHKPEQFKQ